MKEKLLMLLLVIAASVGVAGFHGAAADDLPYYLADRGKGTSLSMFATYIEEGEIVIYPFYEYYYDQDAEYSPAEFGYDLDEDFRGRYRAHEGLIFLGYGITADLAAEFEAAVISAKQYRSDDDPSDMPEKVEESGVGDVEGQLRWRFARETAGRPEFFTYFETVFPLQKDRKLIGTQHWEYKLGFGATKGFRFGTLTLRTAAEYSTEESKVEAGEYAAEYVKRISDFLGFYAGVEGSEDEVELIIDLQLHISPNAFIRVNNAFGATSKATDYAPEFGVLFHFP